MAYLTYDPKTKKITAPNGDIQNNIDTQLPSRGERKQEVVDTNVVILNELTAVSAVFETITAPSEVDTTLEFSLNNIPRSVLKFSFEDFRPNKYVPRSGAFWHTVVLTSKLPQNQLFVSLVKKLVVTGININELLVIEYVLSKNWAKLSSAEQIFGTVLLKVAFATVNGAKTFSSFGKPLYKQLNKPTLIKAHQSMVVLFFKLYDLLDVKNVNKSVKLTFIEFPTKAKKFPAKKHIGVTNSQDGNKSASEEILDEEIRPESESLKLVAMIEHEIIALSRLIIKYITIFKL